MADFPAITPSSRTFKPGVYPQRSYRSLNGAVVKRTFGNSPYSAVMELSFDNISDFTVIAIIDHYNNQTAANARFKLSSNVTAGLYWRLADQATAKDYNLRWEYKEPPEIQSVRPNVSNVRVSLVGEIRDPLYDA